LGICRIPLDGIKNKLNNMSDKKEQRNNLRPAWPLTEQEKATEKKIIIDKPSIESQKPKEDKNNSSDKK